MYYVLCIMRLFLPIILATYFILQTTSPVYAACDAAEMAKPVGQRSADCPAGLNQIEQVFTSIISTIVGLGFIAMLVLLVIAGIKYLTSGGEPKAIQSAHETVTWALLGVLFLAIAWLILQLIGVFTGVEVTSFNIRVLCGPNGDWCKNP